MNPKVVEVRQGFLFEALDNSLNIAEFDTIDPGWVVYEVHFEWWMGLYPPWDAD